MQRSALFFLLGSGAAAYAYADLRRSLHASSLRTCVAACPSIAVAPEEEVRSREEEEDEEEEEEEEDKEGEGEGG